MIRTGKSNRKTTRILILQLTERSSQISKTCCSSRLVSSATGLRKKNRLKLLTNSVWEKKTTTLVSCSFPNLSDIINISNRFMFLNYLYQLLNTKFLVFFTLLTVILGIPEFSSIVLDLQHFPMLPLRYYPTQKGAKSLFCTFGPCYVSGCLRYITLS